MSSDPTPTPPQFTIDPNWKVILLCLVTLPILISLGFWQLDRALQKEERQAQLERVQSGSPEPLRPQNAAQLPDYQRVLIRGRYIEERNWLLDNRHRGGHVGYEVVSAFAIKGGGTVLVNRGWVPAGRDRSERPDPEVPPGELTLFAQLMSPSDHPLLDGQSQDAGWPKVILALEPEVMSEQVGRPALARYARLDDGSPGALNTHWPELEVNSTTHRGYAFQWFAMSVALVLWCVFANSNLWAWWHGRRRG